MVKKIPKPCVLVILDGWGIGKENDSNAILLASPTHFLNYWKNYPHSTLDASGHAVGLPDGIMGNSEVGHMAIGAGRIVYQGLSQIYHAIEDGSFFVHPVLLKPFRAVKASGRRLHVIGLVSDGAVHSHQDHLYALLEMAKREGVTQVAIHAFLDGRDTPPKSALTYIGALEEKIRQIGVGKIATVSGRYYAMDRDKRWDRTEKAYRAMVHAEGVYAPSAEEAIQAAYVQGITDEFVLPTVIDTAKIDDGDAVIFFNFRPDRARQIARALTQKKFDGFKRDKCPALSAFTCMAEYERDLGLDVVFHKDKIADTLPEILSRHGLKQLRIAETEKFAHVTYFLNGGEETIFPGEDRILIPSPREIATYDQKPQMSAREVKAALLQALAKTPYDMVVLNFANPDMVGHTANIGAAVEAVRSVDECLHEIVDAVLGRGGAVVVTADHGNCEKMRDDQGNPHTAHTTNLVPFILIDPTRKGATLAPQGRLCDIAPTLLEILKISKPDVITGVSLFKKTPHATLATGGR